MMNQNSEMSDQAVQTPPEQAGLSIYMTATVALMVAIVVTITGITVYHSLFSQKQKYGVIDIAEILETTELLFTEKISGDRVTDADREAAYDMVRDIGPRLDMAIEELQQSCECFLMAKAAVIGNVVAVDYTAQVKEMLGIDKVDVKAMQERIRQSMNKTGDKK